MRGGLDGMLALLCGIVFCFRNSMVIVESEIDMHLG